MTNTVRDTSAAVATMETAWAVVRPLLGGTTAMRAAGKTLLPKWPMEEETAYASRLACATLFPAYSRTVATLAGKPFSKALTIGDDVPERIREWSSDIDLSGRNLHTFAADVFETALGYGVSGILVEYPPADGVRTQAQEKAAGLRPYMIHLGPGSILGWKSQRVAGRDVLTQLRFLEAVTEDDGEFGETTVEQVRVLRPGSWEIWRQPDSKSEWVLFAKGTTTLKAIPFIAVYGARTGFMTGKPPLLEMAHLNVEHWQSSSDQRTILHVARVPILTIAGADDNTAITVGAASAVKLPQGANMAFVEHSGAAIEAGRISLQDLEEQMRQAGAELLVLQPGKVTATQISTENAVGMCALQRMALDFEDALNAALQFMADWVGEKAGGHCKLFADFGAASLAEASAQLLLQANQAGRLSNETLFAELKRRGIVAADVEWEDEVDRLAEQGPALGTVTEGNVDGQ